MPNSFIITNSDKMDKSGTSKDLLTRTTYPNISVKTEGTTYTVYSNNDFIIALEKVAPRIVVDQNGNRYHAALYLSKEYELQFVNQSSINLSNLKLIIGNESYTVPKNKISKGHSLSFYIPRDHSTFHQTITLDITFDYKDEQGHVQQGKTIQPFTLDNSYSDYYTLAITGDSYDTLTLELQAVE
ncbi:hypothetical protein P9B03_07520 [Metasolibacillus meyeri]|uniref:Uncharacterized protein n=2 Tax=Metasolibacillus meyeri TaxID=1071052 RepID=A0AAW9NP79_9BACL|nr:hypothetical protein [Metasolibacillus meyeri]MEC1178326.1 hypothetical protein [Metasolibacillus meyeri]